MLGSGATYFALRCTILVAVILVLVLGFVSLTGIQTDLLPAMNLPYLMVITTYPAPVPSRSRPT